MIEQNSMYKLSNGVEIPCIGFGMWQTQDALGCPTIRIPCRSNKRF